MFTGIIEQMAKILEMKSHQEGLILTIEPQTPLKKIELGESIAVNGCCLTVIKFTKRKISFDLSSETLSKTNFGQKQVGDLVNIERALRLGDRLGGHLVSGHIDGQGRLEKVINLENSYELIFSYPKKYAGHLIEKGSITIDGISLTVSLKSNYKFAVYIIPHTWKITTLSSLPLKSKVNLEFDLMGKYIERLLSVRK